MTQNAATAFAADWIWRSTGYLVRPGWPSSGGGGAPRRGGDRRDPCDAAPLPPGPGNCGRGGAGILVRHPPHSGRGAARSLLNRDVLPSGDYVGPCGPEIQVGGAVSPGAPQLLSSSPPGISRLYLGAHRLSCVIGVWAGGHDVASLAAAVRLGRQRVRRRAGTERPEQPGRGAEASKQRPV